MKMVISGKLNGKSEKARAKLIKEDWESKGYTVTASKPYNPLTHKRATELLITH